MKTIYFVAVISLFGCSEPAQIEAPSDALTAKGRLALDDEMILEDVPESLTMFWWPAEGTIHWQSELFAQNQSYESKIAAISKEVVRNAELHDALDERMNELFSFSQQFENLDCDFISLEEESFWKCMELGDKIQNAADTTERLTDFSSEMTERIVSFQELQQEYTELNCETTPVERCDKILSELGMSYPDSLSEVTRMQKFIQTTESRLPALQTASDTWLGNDCDSTILQEGDENYEVCMGVWRSFEGKNETFDRLTRFEKPFYIEKIQRALDADLKKPINWLINLEDSADSEFIVAKNINDFEITFKKVGRIGRANENHFYSTNDGSIKISNWNPKTLELDFTIYEKDYFGQYSGNEIRIESDGGVPYAGKLRFQGDMFLFDLRGTKVRQGSFKVDLITI